MRHIADLRVTHAAQDIGYSRVAAGGDAVAKLFHVGGQKVFTLCG
jgi:hypothetical protein